MNAMQFIANARIGKAVSRWENGREYLVAPITSIVPGILPGSDGPGLYLAEDIKATANYWDGIPLTAYHPVGIDGQPASAQDDGVAERQWIGQVRDSVYHNKLKHSGWFDAELTKRIEPRIYHALKQGMPIETSTGLHLRKQIAPQGALHNGRPYSWTAKNYRPDHLAVLPDQVGACSINDGCGVLVNKLVLNTLVKNCSCGNKCAKCQANNRARGTDHKPQFDAVTDNCGVGCRCAKCQASRAVVNVHKVSNMFRPHIDSLIDNADQGRHPENGTFQGRPHTTVKSGFSDLFSYDNTPAATEVEDDDSEPTDSMQSERLAKAVGNANPEGHNQYTGGGGGHKERLEKKRTAGGAVLRTSTGYREDDKHGSTHYDHNGNITHFEPKQTSHAQRFAPKGRGTMNASRCSECGGDMKDGECEECGYEDDDEVENAFPPQPQQQQAPAPQQPQSQQQLFPPKKKKKIPSQQDQSQQVQGDDIGTTQNLLEVENANPQGINQYTKTAVAKSSSAKAMKSGKSKDHMAASKAHLEAAKYHHSKGNSDKALAHLQASLGHDKLAAGKFGGAVDLSGRSESSRSVARGGSTTRNRISSMFNRERTIDFIVVNSDCTRSGGEDAARLTLNDRTNEQLLTIKGKLVQHIVDNAAAEGVVPSLAGRVSDPKTASAVSKKADEEDEDEDDDLDNEDVSAKDVFTGNRRPRQMTMNQWMQTAPPQVRNTFKRLQRIENQQKQQLVNQLQLIANNDPDQQRRQYIVNRIGENLSIDALQELLILVRPVHNSYIANSDDTLVESEPLFLGSGGPEIVSNRSSDSDDILEEVTMNFKSEDPNAVRKGRR